MVKNDGHNAAFEEVPAPPQVAEELRRADAPESSECASPLTGRPATIHGQNCAGHVGARLAGSSAAHAISSTVATRRRGVVRITASRPFSVASQSAVISVSPIPGRARLPECQCRAHWKASSRVKLTQPALLAAYPACGRLPLPTIPATDAMFTMAPPHPDRSSLFPLLGTGPKLRSDSGPQRGENPPLFCPGPGRCWKYQRC